MPSVLTDTTVLSNFAHIRRPGLLRLAFPSLFTTPAVLEELASGLRSGQVPQSDWSWLRIVELTEEERHCAQEIGQSLGPGEAACLAVAQIRGWMVLTDDRAARHLAVSLGLELSGTLGALGRLLKYGHFPLDQVDSLLQEMIDHGYRSPIRSFRRLPPE